MISIIKPDIKSLNTEIYSRVKPPSYLIMSESTFSAIKHEVSTTIPRNCIGGFTDREFTKYAGVPIAICNALQYGVVDIKD